MTSHETTQTTNHRRATPALFRCAGASRDLPIVAFAAAVLLAFIAHAGAFVPRIEGLERARSQPTAQAARAAAVIACEATAAGGTDVPRC